MMSIHSKNDDDDNEEKKLEKPLKMLRKTELRRWYWTIHAHTHTLIHVVNDEIFWGGREKKNYNVK